MALSCSDVQGGLASAERDSYVVLDDGSYAQRIIEVEGGTDLGCTNIVSSETLRFGSLVQYEPGKWAKQVVIEGGFTPGPSALVSDAGSLAVNGSYDEIAYTSVIGPYGPDEGYPIYQMGDVYIMHLNGTQWYIIDPMIDESYYRTNSTDQYPWDASGWTVTGIGEEPPPTVTEDA